MLTANYPSVVPQFVPGSEYSDGTKAMLVDVDSVVIRITPWRVPNGGLTAGGHCPRMRRS